jgi:hypothetical protein
MAVAACPFYRRASVMMCAPRWAGSIHDLYRHEQRCHLSQVLLPTEQDTRRYPIATRHVRQAGAEAEPPPQRSGVCPLTPLVFTCEKWTVTVFTEKFPVPEKKFPVLQNIFPVNLLRELREK